MSKRRVDVDTGSVHLPAGVDDTGSGSASQDARVDPFLIRRFRDALDGRRSPRQQQQPVAEEEPLESPFALLGGPEPFRQADTGELGLAIERMWVADGATGVREVRVKLNARLLPDTTVRLYEAAGRLHVELNVESEEIERWLNRRAGALARDLGERLQRSMRVSLFAPHGVPTGSFDFDWQQEQGP